MISTWMTKVLGQNWKTTLAGLLAFLGTVPSLVTAIEAWSHHQPADWRAAVVGIVVAGGLWAAKDSTTHSTSEQVAAASVPPKA